ncbi:hypothetical protein TEA_017341 [Camellia sinensis var. sinensis]|uniref:Pentacotripeptide-repeat region of PRORP domain-containing protein n=1 Tax=Camellia sinensis var. sinensis TaxID=542762 RepID=A0A4S4DT82_CAMSN|nr:hypothetical protein TEA_017341 [Camellia sinensis var. sinensis]
MCYKAGFGEGFVLNLDIVAFSDPRLHHLYIAVFSIATAFSSSPVGFIFSIAVLSIATAFSSSLLCRRRIRLSHHLHRLFSAASSSPVFSIAGFADAAAGFAGLSPECEGDPKEDDWDRSDKFPIPIYLVPLVQSFIVVTNSLSHSHMATSSHLPPTTDPLIRIRDPSLLWRSKKCDCLDQILEEMNLSGFGPSNIPEPDLMLTLFHQMQELGYEMNVQLFTMLICVFAKEGRVDTAFLLLDEMKNNCFDADIVLYNVCIDCFGKVGKVDVAWKFFHEMKANGLMPDNVTYTSMIGVLWKANRLNEAVELFEQMELNRKVPCAYAYNTMIMAYGSAGKFDEAYNLLERQKPKGSIPSVIAYNSILTCLAKNGRVDEALRIFEEMKNNATPNLSTYNILIGMLCKAGKVEEALVIQEAMKGAGLFPNVLTMNIMIDRLLSMRHETVREENPTLCLDGWWMEKAT